MSEHRVKVSFSPENIEILKEKYGLDDTGLKELLGHIEVIAPIEAYAQPAKLPIEPYGELSGERQLMSQLSRGDLSMAEAIMYMDMQDRKERRDRREQREEAREKAGNVPEEKPEWFKELIACIKNKKE